MAQKGHEPNANGQRILGFDGLRAIAFLAVFVSHKVPNGRLEAVGTTGVWLFFVLSGFLITRILASNRENIEQRSATFSSSLGNFYLRRTARILPVYYAFLGIITLLVWGDHIYAGTSGRQIANWLFVTNIYVEQHGWETDLGHLWSLAVEEQFYLSFAPLALLVPRRRLGALCVGLVIFSVVAHVWLWLNGASLVVFDASSLTNLGLLALGGWAGLNADRSLPRFLLSGAAVAANVVTIFVLPFLLARTGLWPVVGRLSGFLMVLLLLQVFQNQRGSAVLILDAGWVREIGLVSYGAYLFHPVIHAQALLGYFAIEVALPRAFLIAIEFMLTLALAELSWRLFERPIQHFLRRSGRESRNLTSAELDQADLRPAADNSKQTSNLVSKDTVAAWSARSPEGDRADHV